jgi:hypothetical protein
MQFNLQFLHSKIWPSLFDRLIEIIDIEIMRAAISYVIRFFLTRWGL